MQLDSWLTSSFLAKWGLFHCYLEAKEFMGFVFMAFHCNLKYEVGASEGAHRLAEKQK